MKVGDKFSEKIWRNKMGMQYTIVEWTIKASFMDNSTQFYVVEHEGNYAVKPEGAFNHMEAIYEV